MRKTIVNIISVLLVVLWTYAAISKLVDYNTFKFQLGQSPLWHGYANILSIGLPCLEICVALILISERTRLMGLYASFTLMLLFTGYIYYMLHYSYFIPCSCGGILGKLDWNSHLIFNIAFTLISLIAILIYKVNTMKTEIA